MAKVTKVRVSVGFTKNAGNYESARVEETLEMEIGPDEKVSVVLEETREYLKTKVHNDALTHAKYMKSTR